MATIVFGDSAGGGDTNVLFSGNVALDGARIISESGTDDSLALDWKQLAADADTRFLWRMDEASWNTTPGEVKDAKESNDGTAVGNADTAAGWINRSGHFPATTDRVTLVNNYGWAD